MIRKGVYIWELVDVLEIDSSNMILRSFTPNLIGAPLLAILLAATTLAVSSCSIYDVVPWRNFDEPEESPERVAGMRPVYGRVDAYDVYSDVTRAIEGAIGVFTENGLLFTIDAGRGIHVADNTDPSNPRPLVFIRILGVNTASVTDNFLYANNFEDFLTIDISNLDEVRVVDRQEDLYDSVPDFPGNGYRGFFECYDPSRGPLNGWENATIFQPQCRI